MTLIRKALVDTSLKAEEIDRVLLVGGSTRIPAVWDLIVAQMGQEPHIEIDPDAAVALGAAVQAGTIVGEEIDAILVDVTPYSLGSNGPDRLRRSSTATSLPPWCGATPPSPCIRARYSTRFSPARSRSTSKPTRAKTRWPRRMSSWAIIVEEPQPDRPDGLSDVTVNFQLDVNGILDVTVVERKSGKRFSERLKASRQRLSPEDIAQSQEKSRRPISRWKPQPPRPLSILAWPHCSIGTESADQSDSIRACGRHRRCRRRHPPRHRRW